MSSRTKHRRVTGDRRRVDNIPQIPPPKNLQAALGQFQGAGGPLPLPLVATPAGSACTRFRGLRLCIAKPACTRGAKQPRPAACHKASKTVRPQAESGTEGSEKLKQIALGTSSSRDASPLAQTARFRYTFSRPRPKAAGPRPFGIPALWPAYGHPCPDAGGGRPCPPKNTEPFFIRHLLRTPSC